MLEKLMISEGLSFISLTSIEEAFWDQSNDWNHPNWEPFKALAANTLCSLLECRKSRRNFE
jgi:hypothetical protein